TLPPSGLPAISPTRGEISLHFGRHLSCDEWRKLSRQPISPRVGEMAGRPEGGNVGRRHDRPGSIPQDLVGDAAVALDRETPPARIARRHFAQLLRRVDLFAVDLAHDVARAEAEAGGGRVAIHLDDGHALATRLTADAEPLHETRRQFGHLRAGKRAAPVDDD